MSKEMEFFIFLLENYAADNNLSATEVFNTWKSAGIIDNIFDMYEFYHSERLENAYEDIDRLLATRA